MRGSREAGEDKDTSAFHTIKPLCDLPIRLSFVSAGEYFRLFSTDIVEHFSIHTLTVMIHVSCFRLIFIMDRWILIVMVIMPGKTPKYPFSLHVQETSVTIRFA